MFPISKVLQAFPRDSAWAAFTIAVATLGVSQSATAADAPASPGLEAIETFRESDQNRQAVENRFFSKQERFEISPIIGYVPNNPFAVRYVGGAILGYHFNEVFSAQAQISYSPDQGENDLKGLVSVLLDRAYNAGADVDFQQPLDKVQLSAAFGVAWAPIYGKINLVGETVLNFDLYGFAGAAMISKSNHIATYNESADPFLGDDIVNLVDDPGAPSEVLVAPVIGIGQNYFLNQMMCFKMDARAAFYVDNEPQYDPNSTEVLQKRLYNNFIVSGGVGFFFPRMKPRLYDF
jgi:outer membrane beta-barrel protein